MADGKHIIWSNLNLDIDDGWREAYAEVVDINDWERDEDILDFN